jgi:hypothetical protein
VATCLENTETINCQKILELREIQIFGQDTQNQIQKKAVDAYYEIANKHSLDLAQMSLKFLEIQPFVTFCYYWCNNNGAVENKYRKCKHKSI